MPFRTWHARCKPPFRRHLLTIWCRRWLALAGGAISPVSPCCHVVMPRQLPATSWYGQQPSLVSPSAVKVAAFRHVPPLVFFSDRTLTGRRLAIWNMAGPGLTLPERWRRMVGTLNPIAFCCKVQTPGRCPAHSFLPTIPVKLTAHYPSSKHHTPRPEPSAVLLDMLHQPPLPK